MTESESKGENKLSKQERRVLYYLWKQRISWPSRLSSVGAIHSELFIGELDQDGVKKILESLANKGYIEFSCSLYIPGCKWQGDEFGIPDDPKKFQEIERLFRWKSLDWYKDKLKSFWDVLMKAISLLKQAFL